MNNFEQFQDVTINGREFRVGRVTALIGSWITTQTMPAPDSGVWAYTGYSASEQKRTSTRAADSKVKTEYLSPPFLGSDIGGADVIPVERCLNTGVTVSGVELVLIARTGRQWAAIS